MRRALAVSCLFFVLQGCDAQSAGSTTGADSSEGGGDTGGSETGTGAGGGAMGGASSTSSSPTSGSTTSSSSGVGGLGADLCPEPEPPISSGFAVGDQLANVVVKDCEGNDVALDDFCGADGFWIFAAHGWCPLCQSVSGKQEGIVADYAGLAAVNVLLENGTGGVPDEAYCALWRDTHGHDAVVTLFDPTGEVLALWPNGSTSLSAFVDRDRIVRSKLEHESSETLIRQNIEAALAP